MLTNTKIIVKCFGVIIIGLVILFTFFDKKDEQNIDWCKKCRDMETYYYSHCIDKVTHTNKKWDGQTPEEFCETHTLKDVMNCIFEHNVAPCEGTK